MNNDPVYFNIGNQPIQTNQANVDGILGVVGLILFLGLIVTPIMRQINQKAADEENYGLGIVYILIAIVVFIVGWGWVFAYGDKYDIESTQTIKQILIQGKPSYELVPTPLPTEVPRIQPTQIPQNQTHQDCPEGTSLQQVYGTGGGLMCLPPLTY